MCGRKIGRVGILFCVFALSSSAVFADTTQSKPSPSSSSKASSKYVKQPSNDVDRDKHPPSEESDTSECRRPRPLKYSHDVCFLIVF